MASTSSRKLRRLGGRVPRILARRAGEAPALLAYKDSLLALATAFNGAYDTAAKYENSWRKEMREGRGAVAALLKSIRGWLPLVVRDVPGFDSSTFGDQPDVPDDVLADGERLVSVIDETTLPGGASLAYKAAAIADLEPVLQAAQKEWQEAEAADSQYQKLLAAVRAAGNAFDTELQLFRRTLSSIAGRQDKDFQKLRSERAAAADEDDDPAAPPASPVVEPAPPGATSPK